MHAVAQAFILLLIAALASGVNATLRSCFARNGDKHENRFALSAADAATLDTCIWVDARSVAEFDRGHIDNALRLEQESWEQQFPELLGRWLPNKPIVVYCSSARCGKAQAVALRLRAELGAQNVYWLIGGWDAWTMLRKP